MPATETVELLFDARRATVHVTDRPGLKHLDGGNGAAVHADDCAGDLGGEVARQVEQEGGDPVGGAEPSEGHAEVVGEVTDALRPAAVLFDERRRRALPWRGSS